MGLFEQPKNLTTTYIGKINPERKGNVKITITETGLPLSSANIIINNDINKGEVANINGMVEFETQRIQTITYYFLNESNCSPNIYVYFYSHRLLFFMCSLLIELFL